MTSDLEERTLTISGVKVVFPCKPYPSQFGMMDRVIKGLERGQNSLLESPTGSGKSLALLCSALAWQVAQHEKLARSSVQAEIDKNSSIVCCCKEKQSPGNVDKTEYSPDSKPASVTGKNNDFTGAITVSDDDEDDDFKPSSKYRTPTLGKGPTKKRDHVKVAYEETGGPDLEMPINCTCGVDAAAGSGSNKQKVPKIYFGTRTHKQIAQITRELGKTAYHDVRMAILASREYTCVHPEVTKLKNKNEGCHDRLDAHGPGCTFHDRVNRVFLSQRQLQESLVTAWDLEDFVGTCKKKKACPYFVTRNIKQTADIIFCPYNYLIDPLVRKSMDINLKDQVVILDEAHNIEDCARDAASGSLTTDQLHQTIHNIQQLLDNNVKVSDHIHMKRMLENLLQFIEENSSNLAQADYDTSYKVWSGFDIVARLKSIGLGPESFAEYKACLERVSTTDEEQEKVRNQRNVEVRLNSTSLNVLELVVQILDYMYRDDLRFVEDYRVAIMKSMQFVPQKNTNDVWMSKNRRGGSRMLVHTLNFWCMNPAVAFSDFIPCRNVVLSSGTLSPMSSFASELGVPFPIQLEANHVIKDNQVWVGALGSGPSGTQLQAVYKTMETFTFQDELGNLIHQVCTSVPHGVLCFLPSYRSLEKFTERWKLTGLWRKLSARKRIMVEPRRGDREDFDGMMKAFYEVVKGDTSTDHLNQSIYDDQCEDDSDIDGALFFAVCRGKVSEGMDFADNNARAVITVGIPYPNFKDLQVKLKREYNDKHRVDRGLLSGSEWYEIQAFRALNQALGRCIRHRKDWGALIIVDDRFVRNTAKYSKGLSKWVRNKLQTQPNFHHCLSSLTKFTETMVKEMPAVSPDTSFIPCTPATPRGLSVYNRAGQDTTMYSTPGADMSFLTPGSSHQHSQYFSPKPSPDAELARKLLLTPSPQGQKVNIKGNNPVQTFIAAPGVVPLSVEQQLKQIMQSGNVPKDQQYYVIINKGQPNEQVFLVDPEKTGSVKTNPATIQSSSNTNGEKGSKPIPCFAAPSGISSLSMEQQLNQIISSGSVPKHQKYYVIFNKGHADEKIFLVDPDKKDLSNKSNAESESGVVGNQGNVKVDNPVQTFSAPAGVASLPVEEQLKQIISSGDVPKDKPYYVIINKGLPKEQIFLVDPEKKKQAGASQAGTDTTKPGSTSLEAASRESEETTSVSMPIGQRETGVGAMVRGGRNRFLKFCNLPPKNPVGKVPVATVTPQRANQAVEEDNSNQDEVSEREDIGGLSVIDTKPDVKTNSADKSKTNEETDDITSDSVCDTHFQKPGGKRKPIFKKKECQEETSGMKSESSDVCHADVQVKDGTHDCVVVKTETASKKNVRKSIAEKLRQFKREDNAVSGSSVNNDEAKDENDIIESVAVGKTAATDDDIDEDFLNLRRRSGRKRKPSSKLLAAKRSRGVEYDGDEDAGKENKDRSNKAVTCSKCGHIFNVSTDYKKHKSVPLFLKVSATNSGILEFSDLDIEGSGLQCVTMEIAGAGMETDCYHDKTARCCVQFLRCGGCVTKGSKCDIVGARVVMAKVDSKWKENQAWLLTTAVCINR